MSDKYVDRGLSCLWVSVNWECARTCFYALRTGVVMSTFYNRISNCVFLSVLPLSPVFLTTNKHNCWGTNALMSFKENDCGESDDSELISTGSGSWFTCRSSCSLNSRQYLKLAFKHCSVHPSSLPANGEPDISLHISCWSTTIQRVTKQDKGIASSFHSIYATTSFLTLLSHWWKARLVWTCAYSYYLEYLGVIF